MHGQRQHEEGFGDHPVVRPEAGSAYRHILKVLFFAGNKHLNEYGPPVLGDTYEAYPYGRVARTVYSLIKQDDSLESSSSRSKLV
jgi:uncharacterized phage-associated protein